MLAERAYTPEYTAVHREFKVRPAQKNKKVDVALSTKAKRNTLMAIVILGIICIAMVVVTALSANLAYSNSQLQKENKELASEIQELKIGIQSSGNVETIEKAATAKLGMIAPTGSQFVQVENNSDKVENFAAKLKSEAFK